MTALKLPAVLLLAASFTWPFGGRPYSKTEQGNAAYENEQYEEALRDYTEAQVDLPDSSVLHYNIGNVLYRQGDPEGAAEAYRRALQGAPEELVAATAYNLGNAEMAAEQYQAAIEAYRRGLEADPGDVDAKRNLELALRALEQQQQQQEEQQQDSQDSQDQQDQQDRQNQQNQQDQQDQQDPQDQQDSQQQERQEDPQDSQDPQQQQPQPREGKMSPDEARRLLDGVAEQEKEAQEKTRQAAAVQGSAREKDW